MMQTRQRALRLFSALLTLMIIGSLFLTAAPQAAHAVYSQQTVFLASFDGLASAEVTTPTRVTIGTVEPEASPVSIVSAFGSKALRVGNGTGSALLVLDKPLGATMPVSNSIRYDLVVQATLVPTSTNSGAVFEVDAAGTRFEILRFSDTGMLMRDGTSLGIAYTANSPIEVLARFRLVHKTVDLFLSTTKGSFQFLRIPLPAGITADNIDQLRYRATAGTGNFTIDSVSMKIEKDAPSDEPPAVIVIQPPEWKVEFENGIPFVMLFFNMKNSGGNAEHVFLFIKLKGDDDKESYLDLVDLSFLEGIGFIKEKDAEGMIIGIGMNNVVQHAEEFKLKFKFKVKTNGKDQVQVKLNFKMQLTDSTGDRDMDPMPLEIPVSSTPTTQPSQPAPSMPTPVVGTSPRLTIDKIDVRFKARWESTGGLMMFGLPLSEPKTIQNGIIVQYFERARFEYHPEFAGTQYEVLLGLLGVELGYKQPAVAAPAPGTDNMTVWFFPETGHYMAAPFRSYWTNRGGLMAFGYPIGEAFRDSNGRLVQYFERARMELHPENAGTEFEVLLGFLGEEAMLKSQSGSPTQ